MLSIFVYVESKSIVKYYSTKLHGNVFYLGMYIFANMINSCGLANKWCQSKRYLHKIDVHFGITVCIIYLILNSDLNQYVYYYISIVKSLISSTRRSADQTTSLSLVYTMTGFMKKLSSEAGSIGFPYSPDESVVRTYQQKLLFRSRALYFAKTEN